MVRKSTKAELVEMRLKGRYKSMDCVLQALLHPEEAKKEELVTAPVVEEVGSDASPPVESC